MNKAKLKTYAPQARKDFIAAVTARANQLGISSQTTAPAERRGDILLVEGREWPASIAPQRDRLIKRIGRDGFAQTMEAVAYTWFNRFAALRYMEIHDYLGHGQRVLSSRDGGLPEVLRHAAELGLPGLNTAKAMEMQLAGNRDGELFKLILVAQCNALSSAMPFLFERIDDESELLLPDNLIRTDSIVTKLVEAIPEEDWQQVEIIGWLYQFYISDRKDEVIGKVVKSEDIPAATQLFTPNWIVQYLVQNSIGRLWMMANPSSPLKSQWPYYIEPAEQTPDVQAQLDALIQTRMADDGGSLNPETITVLDPACGSGHILVVAYDVLKAIYLERGYQPRAIPRLILEKNIFGLDIDDRAAQLAGFALLMKARADDRRLLDNPPRLNVLSLQESKGLDLDKLTTPLQSHGIKRETLAKLLDGFAHAKTFGSLIQISPDLNAALPSLDEGLRQAIDSGDLYARAAAQDLLPLVRQAKALGMQFDAVVANPPYMGARYYDAALKRLVEMHYKPAKGDLYTCFMVRNTVFAKTGGIVGMITIPNWMFLSTFEELRSWLFNEAAIETFSHNGRGIFGSDFGSSAFTFRHQALLEYKGSYKRLFDRHSSVASNDELNDRFLKIQPLVASTADFRQIPGAPVAYWISHRVRDVFGTTKGMGEIVDARQGLATAENGRFLRLWYEISYSRIGFGMGSRAEAKISGLKWFPYNKGGEFRKWYGNQEFVVNWENDGQEIFDFRPRAVIRNPNYYFLEAVSWSDITIAENAFRYIPKGFINDSTGHSAFNLGMKKNVVLSFCNNRFASEVIKVLNPGVHFHIGYFDRLPYPEKLEEMDLSIIDNLIDAAKLDWDSFETSWGFTTFPLAVPHKRSSLKDTWFSWDSHTTSLINKTKALEEENNRLFIEAYGLQDELSSDVPEEQITLARADQEKDCQRLISYAIGCMMGRYSLDEPGLIYAHAGNVGFDSTRYKIFSADADGIVPLTDELWFEDDGANRVREFLLAVWGAEMLEENMAWLAESLGHKGNETPEETIRRYVSASFYKDHLQTYKKRPIYWLFSSGRQGAFQCLVYLHRYHEGTLSRMRAEYVVPLTAKMAARIDLMNDDADAAGSAAARTKINKQIEVLRKKQTELLAFDEKLRHYADMRIQLDLDEGVKVNYGKFGDLLDSVKAITGGTGGDSGDD